MTGKGENDWMRLVAVNEMTEGVGACVCVDGREYAVFVDGGRSFVVDNDCPHQGAALSEGRCEDGTVICPWHGWEFCLHDGRFLLNDAVRIGVYPSKIEDEFVWARLAKDP